MRAIDPADLDRGERNGLINGLIAPRPIAWVSSLAPDGTRNLAPFSFFGAFSFDPPTVGIGPGSRGGAHKDTLANIRATGEFVINLVNRDLAEAANACSGEFPADVDEWDVCGMTPVPSDTVAPMRVAAAPAALECRVREVIELGTAERSSNNLILAWVTRVHVVEEGIDGLIPDADVLDLVGRMGQDEWCTTRERFTLPRPHSNDPAEVTATLGPREAAG